MNPRDTAIEALEKYRPCDHHEYEECGAAGVWRKCSGCGLQFRSDDHDAIRGRAKEFDTAISSLDQLAPTAEIVKAGDARIVLPEHLVQITHTDDHPGVAFINVANGKHGVSIPLSLVPVISDIVDSVIAARIEYAAKSQPPLDIPEAIKAFESIKEIGERDWSTRRLNTCEDRVKSMVKWANHGITSLTR